IMDKIYNKDQATIAAMYGKNIDEMPMSEIEKMKDELLGSLDKNGQEFLNSVYTDLENGDIDRETFKIIMQELNGTEVSEMDDDSRAYIEKIYEDYKNEEVYNKTFTTVFSGVVSTGAGYIQKMLESHAQSKAVDAAVRNAEKWIKNATALFLNPELAGATNAGNVSVTLTSQFKDKIRNVVNFGAKHGPAFIGAVLDAGSQVVIDGEDTTHATIKAIGHIGTANVSRIAGTALAAGIVTALGLTVGTTAIAVVAGLAIGTFAAKGFDIVYDKWGRGIVDGVIDIGKNVKEGIGNAVSGAVGFFQSVFS